MDRLSVTNFNCGNSNSYIEPLPGEDEPTEIMADVCNPTRLYVFLEQRNWEESLACFRRSPHHARTWLRQQSTEGVTNWKMLPLHAAVAFGAPLLLIKELVTIHPNALQKPDHEGKLPLHYAAIFSTKGQQNVMTHMLKCYPEAMWIKASCGRTAIEYSRNHELQTAERIRMRKKLSENSTDDVYQESSFEASADIDVDVKENERNGTNAVSSGQKSSSDPADARREMAAVSNVSCQKESETCTQQIQKATISNARAIHRRLMKKKTQIPIQTKTTREFQAVDDKSSGGESNETDQDDEISCILKCSTDAEEVDQKGQRTVYLNFATCNEDTDANDSSSEPRSTSIHETLGIVDILADLGKGGDASKKTSKTDATAKHNYSKKRIMTVLQAASSMKSIKRQKVYGGKNL